MPIEVVPTTDTELEEVSQPGTPATSRQGLSSGLVLSPLQTGTNFTLEHGRLTASFLFFLSSRL